MKRDYYAPAVGDTLKVTVIGVAYGADGYLHVTVSHPKAAKDAVFLWGGAIRVDIKPTPSNRLAYAT